jgi:3-methyladenine DNA glycosylase AlkD
MPEQIVESSPMKDDPVTAVRKELKRVNTPENRMNAQQFHKEKVQEYVLRTPILRAASGKVFRQFKSLPKGEILACCETLLKSDRSEERSVAFDWAARLKKSFELSDFTRFESWLTKYVKSWSSCDTLCIKLIGELILAYPELAVRTEKWAGSTNRWKRRASAVSLIVPVSKRQLLDLVFKRADRLLTDPDDLVQKGYGWMLKEASNQFPKEVLAFVMARRDRMPRTALRYAIEKYPPEKRRLAMGK